MIPMLAAKIGPRFNRFPCFVQPKLNGIRCLYQNGVFQSRGEIIWKDHFFPHLLEQLKDVRKDIILDGELYVHGWSLQRINSAVGVNNNQPNEDTPSIEFHVFDVADLDKTFSDRFLEISRHIFGLSLPHIKTVPTTFCHDRQFLDLLFQYYVSENYEGVMLRPDGPYELGVTPHGTRKNSKYLWKYKLVEDGDYNCVAVTQGEGKADIGIGALVLDIGPTYKGLIVHADNRLFHVGTGFTDDLRVKFMQEPPINKSVRVKHNGLSDTGIPLCPRFEAVIG